MDELIDQFGKGGIRRDIPDPRDIVWGVHVGMTSTPFDWNKGYDVEKEASDKLGKNFKITVKDQDGSSSCGGQAWSYYGQVLNIFHDNNDAERSAKFIYAQTFQGVGGSGGNENCNIAIKQGFGLENDTPSYENGQPAGEGFYQRPQDITNTARDNAKLDKAFAYANIMSREADTIAQAVRDNYGCIFGITGSNNGTWRSDFPKPPISFNNSWNHWLYIGKAKLIDGVKHFGTLNSWGTIVGQDGWQWLSEEYVTTMILGYPAIWSVWTMTLKSEVTPPPFKFTQTTKVGSTGNEVRKLQEVLKIKIDGSFGNLTKKAVMTFQTNHNLTSDGIVGAKTRAVLNTFI